MSVPRTIVQLVAFPVIALFAVLASAQDQRPGYGPAVRSFFLSDPAFPLSAG